jgi:hypothetical protein
MLAELAFTPSVFDESVHEDKEAWRNQLRELGSSMYPRTSPSAVMVTDLYSGSWTVAVTAIVKSIKDSASRFLCEGLLKKFKDTTVRRPAFPDCIQSLKTKDSFLNTPRCRTFLQARER